VPRILRRHIRMQRRFWQIRSLQLTDRRASAQRSSGLDPQQIRILPHSQPVSCRFNHFID
jgi:hypothetical protein